MIVICWILLLAWWDLCLGPLADAAMVQCVYLYLQIVSGIVSLLYSVGNKTCYYYWILSTHNMYNCVFETVLRSRDGVARTKPAASDGVIISHNDATALLSNTKIHNRVTTMVLPVVDSHKSIDYSLVVFAFLDMQAGTHFISNRIAAMLNISWPAATLDLKTMNRRIER